MQYDIHDIMKDLRNIFALGNRCIDCHFLPWQIDEGSRWIPFFVRDINSVIDLGIIIVKFHCDENNY